MKGNDYMKKILIDSILEDNTADESVKAILHRLPDDTYDEIKYITAHSSEKGADWATRQFQSIIRRCLSDDEELMQLLDEDAKEFPIGE